ncbi:hypothetical protein H257_09104 [Aphanomyces astaci]|uniref:Cytochrome b5 heme-binding domain-containing protein n=1 Tax=Aphanomyces astaci TaxID=112090 RepID=W4GC07_APHAT|nr:hypothetical protein H257_09104 [Aphanomyces astaci]ETV77217.1 hypothetical protein H257_09104 [Aphanomyces astaci]KAF0709768.1 hypothetical protein AaE_012775 [Aphanomyces astaci]RHY27228.1 hypothetical protein DYB25_012883 [Aphanomyces astaci]RHY41546.1 hypothetical protein DYB34_011991 [Aphanomyces astaci]RHY65626.1 hypothetical protein DYB30_008613 [Aphanomyces astaci]|eukprot:XP_009833523.1 hypothetical protein H257_09104 [Aphanomyces astaci]
MASELKVYTEADVSSHKTADDCWIIIGEDGAKKVYDITKYLDDHPGGPEIVLDLAGKDGNEEFEDIGHSLDARKVLEKYLIGTLKESEEKKKKAAQKAADKASPSSGGGNNVLLIVSVLAVVAAVYYQYVYVPSQEASKGGN